MPGLAVRDVTIFRRIGRIAAIHDRVGGKARHTRLVGISKRHPANEVDIHERGAVHVNGDITRSIDEHVVPYGRRLGGQASIVGAGLGCACRAGGKSINGTCTERF